MFPSETFNQESASQSLTLEELNVESEDSTLQTSDQTPVPEEIINPMPSPPRFNDHQFNYQEEVPQEEEEAPPLVRSSSPRSGTSSGIGRMISRPGPNYFKWCREHPIDLIIGSPTNGVKTRSATANECMHGCFLAKTVSSNITEAQIR